MNFWRQRVKNVKKAERTVF